MKVLIYTNIIVDVALNREPFFAESDRILTFVEKGKIQGYSTFQVSEVQRNRVS